MDDCVVGIDLGATKIALGLVSPEDGVVTRLRFPTAPADGPEVAVERMARAVETLAAQAPAQGVRAVGICTPGPLDIDAGLLVEPPNLPGWRQVPLRQMLADRLGVPVSIEHDARAAGLGEYHYGAGRGARSMVYIVVGTGVGAAIIADGRPYRGMHGTAGEVGHITIDPQGDRCACGSVGCVETFAAGPWLARRYERARGSGGMPATTRPSAPVTGETVTVLAAQGDSCALAVMGQAGEALATAIGSLAMILDIELYVVGSSVSKCGDILLEPTRQGLARHAYGSVAARLSVVCSVLGDDAPILGCAWLARQLL